MIGTAQLALSDLAKDRKGTMMERKDSTEHGWTAPAPGDHLCLLYETDEEHRAAITLFVRQGLEEHEKVLYIADAASPEIALERLDDPGQGLAPSLAGGQLTFLTANETYLRSGYFNPEGMIAFLLHYMEEALAQGYAALRVTGEMTWALSAVTDTRGLFEYEARLNDFLPGSRCLALCQYPLRQFSTSLLLDVLRTHPQTLAEGEIFVNPHYVPASVFLGADGAADDLRHWIGETLNRGKAGEVLRTSEAFFREVTANATDIILIVNQEGSITYASPSVKRLLGYRPEEMMGRWAFDFIHPQELDRAFRDFAEALGKKEISVPNAFRVLHKDGSERLLEGLGKNLLNHPVISGFLMNVQDVTARVATEQALRESKERFRDLYDSAPVGYFEYDRQGAITRVNRTELDMLGYTEEEMVGQPCWKFIVDEEARDQILNKLTGVRPPAHGLERTYRRKDGTTFPVLFEDRLLMDVDGRIKGIRTTIQDITERKRAEKEREKLIQELQKALSEVRKLSGMLPICASCKKIRDDQGYWNQVEAYLTSHSDVQFSHSICPECARKLYPEYYDVMFPGDGERESSQE